MKNFFRKLWHGETQGLMTAAIIVGIASLVADVVGVLRDHILASTFGAGDILDAYYAAFRLPDLLYSLVILGALSAGFIPIFAEYLETKRKEEAWAVAEGVLSVIGVTMMVICGVLIIFAPYIVPLTVPNFTPEKLQTTIELTRIMALSPLFLGLSAVMGGVLQATKRFLAFSLAPVLYNTGIIFGAVVLVPHFGLKGLAYGVVLGAFLHLITQASVAVKLGLRHVRMPSLRSEPVRRILKLMGPRTAGIAVAQVNLVILLSLASALPAGSIAVFNLANNLQSFPVSVFGISFAVAAFPGLARAAGAKREEEFRATLSSAARKITFFLIPSTVGFILLRAQIVRLVLGAGLFSWDDTARTANVLGIFALSILAQSLVALLARTFYAIQDTWTPLLSAIVSEAFNITLALLLRGPLGIVGLAVAFTASSCLNLAILWWLLYFKKGALSQGGFAISFAKTLAASLALFGFGWPVRQFFGTIFPLSTFWQVALQAAGTVLAGGVAFLIVAFLLKSEELKEFIAALQRKWFKKIPLIVGADEVQKL